MIQPSLGTEKRTTDRRQAYPLAFVFIVVAFAATVIGICSPGISAMASGNSRTSIAFVVACLVLCALIGLLIGLYHYRRVTGGVIGFLTGAILGPLLGATAATDDFNRLFIACIVGSAVIVLIGFFYSLMQVGDRM